MRQHITAIRLASAATAAIAAIAVSGALASARAQDVTTVADLGDNVVVETRVLPAVITTGAAGPMWTGEAFSPSPGRITLTLDRVGMPSDPLDPVWPIAAHWDFASDRNGRSFTAELYGNGRANGAMHLRGVITDGYRQGAEVELTVEHAGGGARLVIYPLDQR
jgi:hypothetical protein